ncbi:GNAT family N-acetyltransferase [Vibrio sinaloensis]|uniref:GNAT family N-acetyltransferase n=1 Tax=Photobacterium sp. (strain ATCC 43367) TaxID=379097 RepID=UPI0035EAE444
MLEWRIKKFDQLTVHELYAFLRQRVEIFIVEFNEPYSDLDGKDTHPETYHVMGFDGDKLVAYSRIMPQKLGYPVEVLPLIEDNANDVCIGRVIVDKDYRGKQVGFELMQVSFDATTRLFPQETIFISAQEHLKEYYGKFGFKVVTDRYYEDGCKMLGLRYTPAKALETHSLG